MTHYTVNFFTLVKPGPLVKPRGLKASFGYIGLTIFPFWKWKPSRLMWFTTCYPAEMPRGIPSKAGDDVILGVR